MIPLNLLLSGLSPALIAAAMRAKVDETWSIDGDKITYGMHSSVASNTLTFKLNEQFDQVSPAGRLLQVRLNNVYSELFFIVITVTTTM